MFGKMGDMMSMMSKLKEAQKEIEAVKKQLDQEFLEETSANGNIFVKVSLSGKIETLEVKNYNFPLEELQENIKQLLNKVLEQAKTQYEQKLAEKAKDGLPNLPF